MLTTWIALRHDTDWTAPIPVLLLAVSLTLYAVVDRLLSNGLPGLGADEPYDTPTETAITEALEVAAG